MTFQYFFFDTYVGYFLEALPIALIAGAVYGVIKYRKDTLTPLSQKMFSCLYVCYMAGLIALTVGINILGVLWYRVILNGDSGRYFYWFDGVYNFIPSFWRHMDGEAIGNLLIFLPFGILHPLSRQNPSFKKTVLTGVITVLCIELIQPIFGRFFDINDIILNTVGIVVSSLAFFGIKRLVQSKKQQA